MGSGNAKMIPVVLEASMLDQTMWTGRIGLVLGSQLYVDFTDKLRIEANCEALYHQLLDTLYE